VRELRRCAVCGNYTSVLVARVQEGIETPASGRGRCPSCGSQRLARVPDYEEGHETEPGLPCPRCGQPTRFVSTAIWD
jgi:DNA-directed RNA polymerase subunit RPC12/RpoP